MNLVFELMKAEQHIHQQDERIAYLEALTRQQRASIQGINARLFKLEQRPVTVHNTVNTVVNIPRTFHNGNAKWTTVPDHRPQRKHHLG